MFFFFDYRILFLKMHPVEVDSPSPNPNQVSSYKVDSESESDSANLGVHDTAFDPRIDSDTNEV